VVRATVPLEREASYLDGCYIAGIWTITGEERYYGGDGYTLLRVNSSIFDGGTGAWQVGARYDTIDLGDGVIQGGAQDTWTYSLIWYLSGQLWVSANYSQAKFEDNAYAGDETDGWGARLQYLVEW
jgi:phosphate-selective porin OprO/OprP